MAKEKAKTKISVNIDEMRDNIEFTIENNKHLQENGKSPIALQLLGNSGLGKTSLVEQVALSKEMHYTKINLAQIGEEISELVGYPIKQFEMCKDAKCIWIDDHVIEEHKSMGYSFTGRNRMGYCPPEWTVGKDGPGIFNLDDWTRGSTRAIQAVMEIIHKQQYLSWKLPKGWTVVLTANPPDGDYLVNETDNAQKTRYISFDLRFDIDCWMRYAEASGIDGRCINFLKLHPETVTKECDPRSITNFFNSISSIKDFEKDLPRIQMMGEGSVSMELASLFTTFIANKLDKLIDPKTMIMEKDYAKVKKEMLECIGEPYRADIAAVLSTRILNYSLLLSEQGAIGTPITERLTKLTTENILGSDQKYYIVKGLNSRGQGKFSAMFMNPEVQKMALK